VSPYELNKFLDNLWHSVDRRRRIRLHTTHDFLTEADFRAAAHMTRQQLALAKRRGDVFSVPIGRARYYPRVLLEVGRQPHRLRRLVRLLGPTPPWLALTWLESRWTNLGRRTPLAAIRRGDLYFDALCDAEDQGSLYAMHDPADVPVAPAESEPEGDDQFGYRVHIPVRLK
jgi:hypothetical protein